MISQIKQESEFLDKLASVGGMLRLQLAIDWFLRAATAGLAADSVILLVARFSAFTPPIWLLGAIPLAVAALAVLAAILRQQPSATVAARIDRRLDLKERLTTALELQRLRLAGMLVQAQVDDAMWYVRRIEPWRAFPPRLPQREAGGILVAALVTVALIAIPNPGKQAIEHQAAVATAIKQEAQKLDKTASDIKQNEDQTGNHSPDQQNIDNILNQLQKDLRQQSLTADEALAKLQSAQQKLQANQDPNADALADALQALAANFDNQSLLQQAARDVRAGDYNAAARDLRQAGQEAQSLNQDQKDRLAASLKAAAAAQAKAGNSQLGDSLNQAADSLSNGQENSNVAFSQAASNLQRAGQRSQAQQNLNKAVGQVQQSQNALSQQAGEGTTASGDNASPSSGDQGSQPDSAQSGLGQNGGQPGSAGQQGDGQGQGAGQGQGGQGDGHGSGGKGGETVYTGANSHPEGVSGQQGPNGQVASQDDNSLSDPNNNGANVPYQQVVGQYQQQASQAMDRGSVPLSYRQIVKDYFSSLSSGR